MMPCLSAGIVAACEQTAAAGESFVHHPPRTPPNPPTRGQSRYAGWLGNIVEWKSLRGGFSHCVLITNVFTSRSPLVQNLHAAP